MFKRNDAHWQASMFDARQELPQKLQERLEGSWAGVFYREFFCRLDETIFAPLYSENASRPNTPVNQLVAFEVLKAGQGWTDEQTYDEVCFNLQVRHALGLHEWGAPPFRLRTVYNFRRAVSDYARTHGENLFVSAFEQVTGEQQTAFAIGTTKVRMDSTQVASNMGRLGRLRLLASVTERMYRELSEPDRERLGERFGPYAGDAKRLAYASRGADTDDHLLAIGDLMAWLRTELADTYGDTQAYQTMMRVFREHYIPFVDKPAALRPDELPADGLQSPDDLEATFRRKGNKEYQGYVANVAESCAEDNEQQLILGVQVEPNSADDAQMLVDGAEELAERTQVETLYTDGGYNSAAADAILNELGIEQVQTGIRGGRPRQLGRDAFDWEVDAQQRPQAVTCPNGQSVAVEQGRKSHTFLARFDAAICDECPLQQYCPATERSRTPQRVLRFTHRQIQAARRQQRSRAQLRDGSNPRAAVEATVWSLKSSMRRHRAPYRGLARVTMFLVGSAAMVNIRRLAKLAGPTMATETASTRPSNPSLGALQGLWKRLRSRLAGRAFLVSRHDAQLRKRWRRCAPAGRPALGTHRAWAPT